MQHDASPGPIELELDSLTVRSIAVESDTDERSVRKRLRGERVKGRAGERIEAALMRRGLLLRRAS